MNNEQDFNFQEESIDIKALLFQALAFWKLFVITIAISLVSAYMFNKYADPVYEANAKVLIMTDNQNINPFDAGSFWKQPVNIENEMAILKSFDLTRNAIKTLNWKVSYYRYGQIRENQMFSSNPFTVIIDTTHLQAIGRKFDVVILSDKKFLLKMLPFEDAKLYDYNSIEYKDKLGSSPNGIEKEYNFGEKITTDAFSFTLKYNRQYNDDRNFYFYLNSYQ